MTGKINLHKAISRSDRVNVMAASKGGMNRPFSASKCLKSQKKKTKNHNDLKLSPTKQTNKQKKLKDK